MINKSIYYTVKVASTNVTGFETSIGIVTWSAIFPRLTSAFFNPFLLFPFSTQNMSESTNQDTANSSRATSPSEERPTNFEETTTPFFKYHHQKTIENVSASFNLPIVPFFSLLMTQHVAWQQVLESKPNPCYFGRWRSCWSERVRRGVSTTRQKCTWTCARSSHGCWYC